MPSQLTQPEIDLFFDAHLPHRLTLLRAFASRKKPSELWAGSGDVYRCLKDSALISVRLLLNAMGLKGMNPDPNGPYWLEPFNSTLRRSDDVMIDQLGGKLVDPNSLSVDERRLLAGLYCRADKELAHLTRTYNDEFNTEDAIIEGTNLVTELLKKHLYDEVNRQLPPLSI